MFCFFSSVSSWPVEISWNVKNVWRNCCRSVTIISQALPPSLHKMVAGMFYLLLRVCVCERARSPLAACDSANFFPRTRHTSNCRNGSAATPKHVELQTTDNSVNDSRSFSLLWLTHAAKRPAKPIQSWISSTFYVRLLALYLTVLGQVGDRLQVSTIGTKTNFV